MPAFETYIDSGRSLFFPDLPRINLISFLPLEQQPVPLTWGHIIDIIVFINIGLSINRIPYDCYRRAVDCRLQNQIHDLHLDRRTAKYEAGNAIVAGCAMPRLDARALLRAHVDHEAARVEMDARQEEPGKKTTRWNARASLSGIPSLAGTAGYARLVFSASHSILPSLLVGCHPRSGSFFPSELSLHAFYQEIGASKR
ncbi:MAG: hypothetical protein JW839_04715 [Candidatus Lokiarchaeota archaeon]|nr:hypothetical protein [Candidatus Lokiarchaeota archaeon]